MPKGSKPYPYSRAPKTGGMPPMSQSKAKPKARPKPKAAAAKSAARQAPKPSPWFDPKTGRATRAVETVRKAAAPAVRGAARGAATGSRGGVAGAVVAGAVGFGLGLAAGYTKSGGRYGGKDRGRGAPVGKGPISRPQGKAKSTAPANTAATEKRLSKTTYSTYGGDGGLSSFGKAFKEAEYNRRKKGGPTTFMWKGKSYLAAQKGRKY